MTPDDIQLLADVLQANEPTMDSWLYFFLSIFLLAFILGLGAFLKRFFENAADNANLLKQLNRIETTVNAQASIEEGIAHNFLEKREVFRIKREKIEEISQCLNEYVDSLQSNVLSAIYEGRIKPSQKNSGLRLTILVKLYFREELDEAYKRFNETADQIRNLYVAIASDELPAHETTPDEEGNCSARDRADQLMDSLNQAEMVMIYYAIVRQFH